MEQFTCALCKQIFDTAWTDEEALAELNQNFPGFSPSECELLCEDCFNKSGLAELTK